MLTVEPFLEYGPRVNRALRQLVSEAIKDQHISLESDLVEVGIQQGKHLRSDLILLGALVYTPDVDLDLLARASAAIELQHTSVLMHDDVVDQDGLRRGQPSFHRKMMQKKLSRSVKPKSATAKTATTSFEAETLAVIGADWLFGVALREITLLPVAPEIIARLFQQLTSTGISTCLGELRDLTATSNSCSWQSAEDTAMLKTAYYTSVAPLRMGAILVEAPDDGLRLQSLGLIIGHVFQMQDDLIGLFESPERLGKNAASDIVQDRCSTLIAAFLESASPAQRDRYHQMRSCWAKSEKVDDATLTEMRQLFIDSGARTRLEDEIDRLLTDARRQIEQLEIPERAREGFAELINRLDGRRA